MHHLPSPVRRAVAGAMATLLLAAPVVAAPPSQQDRAAIESVIRQYERALTAADVSTVMALYSAQPIFMPEYAPMSVGRAAVRDAYAWVFSTLKLNGQFQIHEVEVSGEFAWATTSSTGTFTVRATGVEADVGNNEFFLLRREGGNWKIHRYMFNANKPTSK